MSVSNSDENMVFGVVFRTPPQPKFASHKFFTVSCMPPCHSLTRHHQEEFLVSVQDSFLFVDCFELLGSFILCISALLMVLLPRSITRSENVGFISVLWIVSKWCTFWAIYISCFVENRMVFVERIKQFTNIKSEAAWEIKDCLPPPNWPTNLKIDLKELA